MNRAFIKGELQECIEDLKNGELHEKRLQAIVDYLESSGPRQQDLLYLQARDTNLSSIIDGISLVENGEVVEGPADPDDWPYQSVLEAIRGRLAGDSIPQSGADDGRDADLRSWRRVHLATRQRRQIKARMKTNPKAK